MREIYKDQYATVMFEKFFSEKIDTTKVSKNRALFNKLWYNHLGLLLFKSHMNPKTPRRNETTANLTQDRSRRGKKSHIKKNKLHSTHRRIGSYLYLIKGIEEEY